MTDFDTLELSHESSGISTLTLQRPDKLNALDETVLRELRRAVQALGDRDDRRVLLLRGEGRAFIAGADIESMLEMSRSEAEDFGALGHRAMNALETLAIPVVAGVDGFALGGGLEVAVACDLIYASTEAQFGLPEVSLGIIPGFGGTQRLARFVGWHQAREIVLTAERFGADTAADMGLACEVFDADDFDDEIRSIVERIASRGPLALRTAKRVMREGRDLAQGAGLERERQAFGDLFDSKDRVEGMEAFIEGREPEFTGE